jgi:hypothetical protein
MKWLTIIALVLAGCYASEGVSWQEERTVDAEAETRTLELQIDVDTVTYDDNEVEARESMEDEAELEVMEDYQIVNDAIDLECMDDYECKIWCHEKGYSEGGCYVLLNEYWWDCQCFEDRHECECF